VSPPAQPAAPPGQMLPFGAMRRLAPPRTQQPARRQRPNAQSRRSCPAEVAVLAALLWPRTAPPTMRGRARASTPQRSCCLSWRHPQLVGSCPARANGTMSKTNRKKNETETWRVRSTGCDLRITKLGGRSGFLGTTHAKAQQAIGQVKKNGCRTECDSDSVSLGIISRLAYLCKTREV